jgi:hypothetical protein
VKGIEEDKAAVENILGVQSDGLSTALDVLGSVDIHDGVALGVDGHETLVPGLVGLDVLQ